MEKNQRKTGAILSYISIIISNLVALVYTPIMTRLMGQSEYGLYSLVSTIVNYLTILDFGFGNAIIIYTARYRNQGQKENEYKLHGMFLIIYSIIGIIAGILGTILYFNIPNMFGNSLTVAEMEKAKIMFLILIVNLVLTFPLSIFNAIITAYEKFVFAKIVNIVRTILMPCIMLPLLFAGYRSITMVTVITILNLMCLITNMIYCIKKLKIKFNFGKFDISLLKEIFNYSFFIFLVIIIDQINLNVDQFILGTIVGTVAVAIYNVASQFNNIYISFSTAINGVLLPKITKMVQDKASDEDISNEFIKTGRIQFFIMALILTGFIIFGKEFICIVFGREYEISYYIACILLIPSIVPLIQNVGINILQAKNLHRFRTIVYLIIAILNLLISIPLAKNYGGIGSATGTALAITLGQIIIMNVYYYKKAKINIPRFWREIGRLAISVIFLLIMGLVINVKLVTNSFIIIFMKIAIFTVVYSIITWKINMNQYEKGIVLSGINKVKLIFKNLIQK